jgi:alpha-1,3-rhamnosyl/mannosyltransferase
VLRVVVSPGRIGAQPYGPGIHAQELLQALAAASPGRAEITYHWWGRRDAVDGDATFPSSPRPALRCTPLPTRLYRHLHSAPRVVRDALVGRFDVFHHTGIELDPPAPDERLVVSLHDVIGRRWPESEMPEWPGATALLRRARAVITVSEFSRREILGEYGLADDRVVAIPNGCDLDRFRPDRAGPGGDVVDRIGGRPYVLMVGGGSPRKNVARGLEAIRAARAAGQHDLVVVLTGAVRTGAPELADALATDGVLVDLGYRSRDDLAALMAGARLLLFPSLYEGFGLPVVEAMASGCPVVGSDAGAVVEVAGGHAVLVDGSDVEALAGAIDEVAGWDDAARASWASAARARAEQFSWAATADAHLAVYERVADSA